MLNQSAEYALRAVLYMANAGAGRAYKATEIAAALDLPATYLSKIMHTLVRERVLRSVRGPTGGYSLAVAAARLPVVQIVAPFQPIEQSDRCLMGDRACDHTDPCAAHQRWGAMKAHFTSFLQKTTVAEMLTPIPKITEVA